MEPFIQQFVIVGRDPGDRNMGPLLVTGPFATKTEAEEFMELLANTTTGVYAIAALHTPLPSHPR